MKLQDYKKKYLKNLKELEGRNLDEYEKLFVKDRKERLERFFNEVLEPLEEFIKIKVEYLDFVDNEKDFNPEIIKILMLIRFLKRDVNSVKHFIKYVYNVDYEKADMIAKENLPTWELKKINDNYNYVLKNPTVEDHLKD